MATFQIQGKYIKEFFLLEVLMGLRYWWHDDDATCLSSLSSYVICHRSTSSLLHVTDQLHAYIIL